MTTYSLSPYSIRFHNSNIKDLNDPNRYYSLDNIEGYDIADLITDFLNNYLREFWSDSSSKLVRNLIKNNYLNKIEERTISGLLDSAQSGYGSKIIDTETLDIKYERQVSDADTIPLFFLFDFPRDSKKGIIIFQKFSKLGIKTIFHKAFKEYIQKIIGSNIIFTCDILTTKEALKKYIENGKISNIRLIKQTLSSDISENLAENNEIIDGTIEMVIKSPYRRSFTPNIVPRFIKKLYNFLDKKETSINSLIEVSGFEYDSIKLDLLINNKSRVVDISEPEGFKTSLDISDIKLGINGHPKYDKVEEKAIEYLNDLRQEFYLL